MCQVQAKSGGGGGGYDLVEIDVDTGGVTVRRALPDYTPMVPANDTAGGATQCSFSASTGMLAVLFNEVDPDAAAFVRAKKLALLVRVKINPRTRAPPHTHTVRAACTPTCARKPRCASGLTRASCAWRGTAGHCNHPGMARLFAGLECGGGGGGRARW